MTLKDYEIENGKLRSEAQRLANQLTKTNGQLVRCKIELAEIKQLVTDAVDQKERIQKELDEVNEYKAKINKHRQELRDQLDQALSQVEQLKERLANLVAGDPDYVAKQRLKAANNNSSPDWGKYPDLMGS